MSPGEKKISEVRKRFIMDKRDIGFFKSILESYGDMAIFSVLDGELGLIEMIYPSSSEDEIKAIMADMANYGICFREAFYV